MKTNIKFFVFCSFVVFLFSGCASTKSENKSKITDNIYSEYDIVQDLEIIKHKDLEMGVFTPLLCHNINSTIFPKADANVDLEFKILNGKPYIKIITNIDEKAILLESVVFVNQSEKKRLVFNNCKYEYEVTSPMIGSIHYTESLGFFLTDDEIKSLMGIIKNGSEIAILGKSVRTELYKIPKKTVTAMVEMLNYYNDNFIKK